MASKIVLPSEISKNVEMLTKKYPCGKENWTLNSFNIGEKMNYGKHSCVLKVEEKKTGEDYVLKKMKYSKGKKKEILKSSVREFSFLSYLKHPNIIMAESFAISNKLWDNYIVLEYCQEDLSKLLKNISPLNQSEIKCIMQMLLNGLSYLHERLVIHGDICSDNILIHPSGMIKIGDFGNARLYEKTLIDEINTSIGTPGYRAPELCLGINNYTSAIDMWSAGCVFAHMLLHKPLFSSVKDDDNQMNDIIKLCGLPSNNSISELPSYPFVSNNRFIQQKEDNFFTICHPAAKEAIVFLKQFLEYDSKKRIKAGNCLSDQYFFIEPEPLDPTIIKLNFDKKRQKAQEDDGSNRPINLISDSYNELENQADDISLSEGEIVDQI